MEKLTPNDYLPLVVTLNYEYPIGEWKTTSIGSN